MLVKPHRTKSRNVEPSDIERVLAEVERMREVILSSEACVALAHPQIEATDPLRFYVLREGDVFINPVIERHSSYVVDSMEGCMTFKGQAEVRKNRWRKIDLSFQKIEDGKLTERETIKLIALPSFIAQHEIDHLDATYCYD